MTRSEVAVIVAALALLVVGVSLAAVPPTSPLVPRTAVEAIRTSPQASPSPVAAPSPLPTPSAAPSPAADPSPGAAAAAPITVTGPSSIQPWRRAVYTVTFTGAGWRDVAIWWTGPPLASWTFDMTAGHCDVATSKDRLSGRVEGTTVIQLTLVATGWPGGQLVMQGQDGAGSPLGLAVVQVADHS